MKLCILLVLFVQTISFAIYQNVDENRLYTENELDLKPAYPGGLEAMKAFVKKN